jgi:hypothetical protein
VNVDPNTGEVIPGSELQFVPIDMASMDEADLLAMFPTPVQAAGALLIARRLIADAPNVINKRSAALKDARRQLLVAKGYARKKAPGRTAEDRKVEQEADPQVITAGEWVDTCELALEYARERRKSLTEDIDILRSLNANFRGEHREN